MLDLKFLLDNFEQVREKLRFRAKNINFDDIAEKASRRRELCASYDKLRFEQRQCGEEMKKLKGDDAAKLRSDLKKMSDTLKDIESERTQIEDDLKKILLYIPNLPADDVPQGPDESTNVEISRHGEIPTFDFEPKNHWDIAENLGIIDFERAAKVSGARFAFLKGAGCRLELALINYMMRLHAERGYTEIMPPFLVNRDSMTATGQLPKFEEDAYKTNDDLFLIPTAEVPVTNLYRDEILNVNDLPQSFCAYSACFRLEAGNYGKDTRGLIRQHQFDKVELLKFTTAETSEKEHLALLHDAEAVLQGLGLAYRVVMLSSGDMGFSAQKCYDIEVWLPGSGTYREISSCSNFGDFQARRGNIRCKDGNAKPAFVHTINGSGVAVGRALVAILENYQNADGSVRVPKVLQDAMGCDTIR